MRHPVSVLFSSFICIYTFCIENFSNDSDLTSSNDMHHLKSIIVKKKGSQSSDTHRHKCFQNCGSHLHMYFTSCMKNCVFHPKLSWGDQKTIQFTTFLLRHFIALAQLQTKQKSQKFRLHKNSH